MQASLVLILMT